jgi:uncharacterized protein (TIGR03067 family)
MRAAAQVLFAVGATLVVSIGPVAVAAPVPKHLMKEAEGDRGRLQGEWTANGATRNGKPQALAITFAFRGDMFSMELPDQGMSRTATFKLDETGMPRKLLLADVKSFDKTGMPVNQGLPPTAMLSYVLEGDTLTVGLIGKADKEVPDLKNPGPNAEIVVFKRAKK